MEWIKQSPNGNGGMAPKVQYHQPIWNDGTEMPAHVAEFLTTGNDFPNYTLYLTVGSEENARVVFAGHYYSLDQIEEFLVDWAATVIAGAVLADWNE